MLLEELGQSACPWKGEGGGTGRPPVSFQTEKTEIFSLSTNDRLCSKEVKLWGTHLGTAVWGWHYPHFAIPHWGGVSSWSSQLKLPGALVPRRKTSDLNSSIAGEVNLLKKKKKNTDQKGIKVLLTIRKWCHSKLKVDWTGGGKDKERLDGERPYCQYSMTVLDCGLSPSSFWWTTAKEGYLYFANKVLQRLALRS